jgi:competence transcription factor ComK
MSKKSRVGRSALIFFFFITIGKTGNSRARFRYPIFEISDKPSFVLWRVTQFFYLLCFQFRQKDSGWINKTLLNRFFWHVTVNTHIFFFGQIKKKTSRLSLNVRKYTSNMYSTAQTVKVKSVSFQGLSQHGINEKSVCIRGRSAKQHGHDGQNAFQCAY